MAVDTINEKLAVLDMDLPFEPAMPLSPAVFGQEDKQQLLWGFPGFLWALPDGGITAITGDSRITTEITDDSRITTEVTGDSEIL